MVSWLHVWTCTARLQRGGTKRGTGEETVDPKALTATTVKEPPEGLCKAELLISVVEHDFKVWLWMLWKEEIMRKHWTGKDPPNNWNCNRELRDGKDGSTELLLSAKANPGVKEGCCMKIGAVGDKEEKMAGDLERVPFDESTTATDRPWMKGSIGQIIVGLVLLLLKLNLHSKEVVSLNTVTVSNAMEPALLGMQLHVSQIPLNNWSYNLASAYTSFSATNFADVWWFWNSSVSVACT
jgi:hypothetical protein